MPADPLIVGWWNDFKESLGGMSRANGYHFDYGEVCEDGRRAMDQAPDFQLPPIAMYYGGEANAEEVGDGEQAAKRSRHYTRVLLGVPVQDEDGQHSRKAFRMKADFDAALMVSPGRYRGSNGRVTTFAGLDDYDGGEDGGILYLTYYIRWDHVTGDHSTMG